MNLFVFGDDPNYWDESNSRGNGVWKIQATDVDEAMQALLPALPFPGELIGRAGHMIIPGISLEGEPAENVIQIWSDRPECIARTVAAVKGMDAMDRAGKSIGNVLIPGERGLEKEIRVIDLPNLMAAWSYRLALPSPDGVDTGNVISPLGQELGQTFSPQRRQLAAFQQLKPRMEMLVQQTELAARGERLEAQAAKLAEQEAVYQAYQAGGTRRRILASGPRAAAGTPYWIFPERLYLDEEVALLMNLVDMDFRSMEALYAWITEQGRWKKLLPQEKCILVTRVRRERKEYGDPIAGYFYNLLNMEHLVFIRDGEFCAVLGCDLELDDPILPPANFMAETLHELQEKVWAKHFKPREKPVKPGLKKDALWETAPYQAKIDPGLRRYPRMEQWLKSEDYGDEVQRAIHEAVQSTMISHMRSQVPFLAYLQGLVDRRGILQIPPGTDILGDQSGRWLKLGNTYATLYDPRAQQVMEKILAPKNIAKGDWIALRTKYHYWALVQVKAVDGNSLAVYWRVPSKRSDHIYTKAEQRTVLTFDEITWLPWDKLAPDVIALLLDDRPWKKEHKSLVPLLAQWERLQKLPKINDTRLDLRR